MSDKLRLIRITTAPISLKLLLRGQFTFFQQQGFEVLTVNSDGPEVNDILSAGVPHQIVPMTRAITPVQDLICLYQLIRLIQKFKPDIVHTHTPKAGLLGMMAAWLCRVPVRMHTVAGLPLMEAKGVKRTVLKITERITHACATNVYPNSMGVTPVTTAGICTWTAADQLSVYYLSMFNPGSTETFRFTFEGDKLMMEILVPPGRRMGPPGVQQPEPVNLIFTGAKMN